MVILSYACKTNNFFVLRAKNKEVTAKLPIAILVSLILLDPALALADTEQAPIVKDGAALKLPDILIEATRLYDNAVGSSNAASQGVVVKCYGLRLNTLQTLIMQRSRV